MCPTELKTNVHFVIEHALIMLNLMMTSPRRIQVNQGRKGGVSSNRWNLQPRDQRDNIFDYETVVIP